MIRSPPCDLKEGTHKRTEFGAAESNRKLFHLGRLLIRGQHCVARRLDQCAVGQFT